MRHEVLIKQANNNDQDYELIAWAVSSGDRVALGDTLAELETSKVNIEVVADRAGIFRKTDEAQTLFRPGDVIGVIYDTEEASAPLDPDKPPVHSPVGEVAKIFTRSARELMARHDLDPHLFQNLDRPVVRQADVAALLRREPRASGPSARRSGNQHDVARVVERSHLEKPSSFAVLKVGYSALEQALAQYRTRHKQYLGLVEVLIKALGELAGTFPVFFTRLDASQDADIGVNVGVTMDMGNGLYLPVLHHVAHRPLSDLAQELIAHRQRAQDGVFKEEHLTGGHITVSVNMEQDVLHVIPIIHPEQTAMLSVGGILDAVRLDRDRQLVAYREFHLGVAYDHRWINGRDAVRFLGELKAVIESPDRIAQMLGLDAAPAHECSPAAPTHGEDASDEAVLRALMGELQAAVRTIHGDAARTLSPNALMHLNSVEIVGLLAHLQAGYPALKVGALYECQTIRELAEYLMARHREEVRRNCSVANGEGGPMPVQRPAASHGAKPRGEPSPWTNGIAVIGMSGRFPQAANLREFWRNLKEMRDCVTEVPANRWDVGACLDRWQAIGKPVDKLWGGFLDDVDRFDAGFFGIAPVDAEVMDPQQRVYLEVAWETLEDAGYTLARIRDAYENRVGVFTGVWYSDYDFINLDRQIQGATPSTWSSFAAISNRVSHCFDFTGPSHAVDAMCASSLVSVHLACNSLRDGECAMALAGGVNLSLHPHKYLMLKERRFLSSDGRCRSFGAGGDGYVPAEGVGAVLLKRIEDALADGDTIHGVIMGSACNHSGKTSGFTVPNPRAQAAVIETAIARAGIDPRAVSYIEAHGTGTSLGDPIELAGLTAAYDKPRASRDVPPCFVGSVKSNIGHCEAAAGIAGLLKVLLQLKHQEMVGSLHARTVNEHIHFEETRFRLPPSNSPWRRPVRVLDGTSEEWPRIAGISSFGAGGVNAHLLVQEFVHEAAPTAQPGPYAIVLSAQSEDRLRAAAGNLRAFLNSDAGRALDIAAVAYTLQIGREAMAVRLGLLAHSMEELTGKLARFGDGPIASSGVFQGHAKSSSIAAESIPSDEIEALMDSRQLDRLLALWVSGATVPWARLYPGVPPRRVSLPAYPFRGDRYWLPESRDALSSVSASDVERKYKDYLRQIEAGALDAEALIRALKNMGIPG